MFTYYFMIDYFQIFQPQISKAKHPFVFVSSNALFEPYGKTFPSTFYNLNNTKQVETTIRKKKYVLIERALKEWKKASDTVTFYYFIFSFSSLFFFHLLKDILTKKKKDRLLFSCLNVRRF